MGNRVVPALLIALLVIVHAQLWIGRGSLTSVNEMQRRLSEQTLKNAQAQADNERLAAEVKDLREGLEMGRKKHAKSWAWSSPMKFLCRLRADCSCVAPLLIATYALPIRAGA